MTSGKNPKTESKRYIRIGILSSIRNLNAKKFFGTSSGRKRYVLMQTQGFVLSLRK